MTSCRCRSFHSDWVSPCQESVLSPVSERAHTPTITTTYTNVDHTQSVLSPVSERAHSPTITTTYINVDHPQSVLSPVSERAHSPRSTTNHSNAHHLQMLLDHCIPAPTTSECCLCHVHTIDSLTEASQLLVPDCETNYQLICDDQTWHFLFLDRNWKHTCVDLSVAETSVHCDSFALLHLINTLYVPVCMYVNVHM